VDDAMTQAVRQLRAERSKVTVDFRLKVLKEGRVSCKKGCNHCCHYPLYISLLEGLLIYQGLHEEGLWTTRLRTKFQEAARATWGQSVAVWMLSNRPCPLLGDDGLCRSYDNRPTHCRATFSRGNPRDCHPHRFNESTLVSRAEVLEMMASEKRLMKRFGSAQAYFPMACAVLLGEKIDGGLDLQDLHRELPW